jgi:hypothetical protein
MSSKRSLLFAIFLFITLVGSFLYLAAHIQFPATQKIANVSTLTVTPAMPSSIPSIPSSRVLGISVDTSKCHAIQIDSSDPQAFLPDSNCTPGVIDSNVTQDNLLNTICHAGYTQTVRPPVSYTNALKKQQIADYGYIDTNMQNYEEDHLISLELGGSPRDPKNLWPEPHPSLNEKDRVENYLRSKVCAGEITLSEAQREITKNWYEIYKQIK